MMNEAELVSSMSNMFNRYWVLSQWWLSISFLVITVAHFGANRLTKLLIVIIIFLYSMFTVYLCNMFYFHSLKWNALENDLQALEKAGDISMYASVMAHGSEVLLMKISTIIFFITFGCTIFYLVYSFKNINKQRQPEA